MKKKEEYIKKLDNRMSELKQEYEQKLTKQKVIQKEYEQKLTKQISTQKEYEQKLTKQKQKYESSISNYKKTIRTIRIKK